MKKEMSMLPNGNWEEIISPIQHECRDLNMVCKEYGWNLGDLILTIEEGDPYEDGWSFKTKVNFCPFCGYTSPHKDKY